jgi:hypothetical protein
MKDRYEWRHCISCNWRGQAFETVHPKHWPNDRLCPNCNDVTEREPNQSQCKYAGPLDFDGRPRPCHRKADAGKDFCPKHEVQSI